MTKVVDGWTVPGFTHVRELGRGASGRVMLAVDDVTQTQVAIKYLDERLPADYVFLTGYRTLARKLSQLEDPGIADLYDFVEGPGTSAAVVMQWIDGVSLRRVLDTQGPTGPLAALAALGGTLAGLYTAHAAGVVHQDVKPGNVLIDAEGETRMTDFGITPLRRGSEPPGTPGYLAPELWDGAAASPASDLYAATVMFYECLTGRRPYDSGATGGRAMTALAKAHREAPVPIEAVPGPLRGLIAMGLAKDPADRPASAERFLEALEEAAVAAYGPSWEAQGRSRLKEMAQATATAPPPPAPSSVDVKGPAARPRSRMRWVLAAAVAVAVVAGGGAAVYGMDEGEDPVTQSTTPAPASTVSSPAPSPASTAAAALATRIERAAARQPGASFSFRRSGCCGPAISARGNFRNQSFSMLLSGTTADTRRAARTILIGETAYVRTGNDWRPVAEAGTQTEGYAPLASQVRWSSSVTNVATLLRNSSQLRRSGKTYRGSVPLATLADQPLYADLASATRAKQVGFTLTLDGAGLPRQLRMTVGTGGKSVGLSTTYAGWGRRGAISAPR